MTTDDIFPGVVWAPGLLYRNRHLGLRETNPVFVRGFGKVRLCFWLTPSRCTTKQISHLASTPSRDDGCARGPNLHSLLWIPSNCIQCQLIRWLVITVAALVLALGRTRTSRQLYLSLCMHPPLHLITQDNSVTQSAANSQWLFRKFRYLLYVLIRITCISKHTASHAGAIVWVVPLLSLMWNVDNRLTFIKWPSHLLKSGRIQEDSHCSYCHMCPLGVHNLFVKHNHVCPLRTYRGRFIQHLPLWGCKGLMFTIVWDTVWNLELTLVLAYPLGTFCSVSLKIWRAVSAIIESACIIWLRRPWVSVQASTASVGSYGASEFTVWWPYLAVRPVLDKPV